MILDRAFDDAIELTGRNTLERLLVKHLCVVQQCLHVFTGLTSDKSNWTMSHGWERVTDIVDPALGGHVFHH